MASAGSQGGVWRSGTTAAAPCATRASTWQGKGSGGGLTTPPLALRYPGWNLSRKAAAAPPRRRSAFIGEADDDSTLPLPSVRDADRFSQAHVLAEVGGREVAAEVEVRHVERQDVAIVGPQL